MSYKLSKLSSTIKYIIAAGLVVTPVAAMTPEEADFNDDGVVNFTDIYEVLTRYGAMRGEAAYREHLDTDQNGVLDFNDYLPIFTMFYQPASTAGTTFSGIVKNEKEEGLGGILVKLGENSISTCTNPDGTYSLDVDDPALFGDTEVSFFGTEDVNNTCPGGSGGVQYPTIPHKPVFVNAGTGVTFRQMNLIGRDLTGAQTLPAGDLIGNPAPEDPKEFELSQETEVSNAGVSLNVAAGCNVEFPGGEPTTISITRVDPGDLPVTQPPGINSSLWVTFQPGGTVIDDCPPGTLVTIMLDNVDGVTNTANPIDETDPDQPQLYEVIDGAFQGIAPLTVLNADGTVSDPGVPGPKLRGTLDIAELGTFGFAWYGAGARRNPCPLTTLNGRVLRDDVNMDPITNALVSVPGIGQVNTDALGVFNLFNVPAHPNSTNCSVNNNPFIYIATAQKDLDNPADGIQGNEIGLSLPTPAVPGGVTSMGDIKIGDEDDVGIVKGEVRKLNSIDPWLHIPLPLPQMSLFANGLPVPPEPLFGDPMGNYQFNDVPLGSPDSLQLDMLFQGLLPPPGGGEPQLKIFDDSKSGHLDLPGQVLNLDFLQLGHGAVNLTVRDQNGELVDFIDVNIFFPGAFFDFDTLTSIRDINGYRGPAQNCFQFTGENGADGDAATAQPGKAFFNQNTCGNTIPMGECIIDVFGFGEFGPLGFNQIGPEDGCFINQHGQVLELELQLQLPDLFGDIQQVQFNQAKQQINPGSPPVLIDVIEVRVNFDGEFTNDHSPFIEIHFDLDQEPTTGWQGGLPSDNRGRAPRDAAVTENVIAQNLGADVRIICNDELLDFVIGVYGGSNAGLLPEGMCEGIDGNGDVVPGLERATLGGPFEFEGDMILLIPKDPLVATATGLGNPNGDWDSVLETGFETVGYGGYGGLAGLGEGGLRKVERDASSVEFNGEGFDILFDVVPNIDGFFGLPEPPATIDPNGNNLLEDPLSDFQCYFGFCDFYGGPF